ncbi:MAG: LysR family transcriptional regulator, partial [Burkholderiaceae bacterium]
ILKAVHAEPQLQVLPLPARYAEVTTHLVWQPQHESAATEALRQLLASERGT